MAKYLWVDSVAERWGVSKSWVYRLCRDGRVDGAFFSEGRWSIPADAEKPIDYRIHKRYVKSLSGCTRLSLPSNLPFKFPGEADRIPDNIEKTMSACADYVLDFVDVHPESGRLLLCALSYAHIKAHVICENRTQYFYFTALRDFPHETHEHVSIMAFEYSMLSPDKQRAYFNEKKKLYNQGFVGTIAENAALILFLAGTNGQNVLNINQKSGDIISKHRQASIGSFISREDADLLSSLLARTIIYKDASEAKGKMDFSEYSALHLSEEQYTVGAFSDISQKAERLIII